MTSTSIETKTPPPLFSPEFQRDPYPTYRRCLAEPRLQPMEGRPGVWLLFGYDECARLIRDDRLSATRPASALVAATGEALGEFDDLVRHMQHWLLLRDAPRHSELRKLMNPGFAPLVIARLTQNIDAIVDRLLDGMGGAKMIDLIRDFAYPLPVRVICDLLGVPEELHTAPPSGSASRTARRRSTLAGCDRRIAAVRNPGAGIRAFVENGSLVRRHSPAVGVLHSVHDRRGPPRSAAVFGSRYPGRAAPAQSAPRLRRRRPCMPRQHVGAVGRAIVDERLDAPVPRPAFGRRAAGLEP